LQFSPQGLLSGTPTQNGLYTFSVQVCDSTTPQPQCLSGTTTLAVNGPPVDPLQILTTSLPGGVAGTPYDVILQGEGGVPPYQWSTTSQLPTGLQVTSGGEISGVPSQPGSYVLNIVLADSQGTTPATAALALAIALPPPPVITSTSLPDGQIGVSYPATQLQASGGQPPYTWAIMAGSLPGGLHLSSSGSISGTPMLTGSLKPKTFSFTVQVKDAYDQPANSNLSITVRLPTRN
jgi:hypothetical protein